MAGLLLVIIAFRGADCEALAIYDLEVNAEGPRPAVLIAERFRVQDGLIQEIEAIFLRQTDPTRCSGACFPSSGLGHEAPVETQPVG